MRSLASSFLSIALIAFTSAPLGAQLSDTALAGRWSGHAELTVPWTVQRSLVVQLDIQPDGSVSGTIGDAVLASAHISSDSRIARALHIGRALAIDGALAGPLIRAEAVRRDRVHVTLDRVLERMVGELQTSGTYDGPIAERILTARVGLQRVGAVVAQHAGAAPTAPSLRP